MPPLADARREPLPAARIMAQVWLFNGGGPVSRVLYYLWQRSSFLQERSCLRPQATYPGSMTGPAASPIWSCSRRGMPGMWRRHHIRWALAPPFHPYQKLAVSFLLRFPGVASSGRYPAPCPAEPGLSSPALAAAMIRPSPAEISAIPLPGQALFHRSHLRSRQREPPFLRAPYCDGRSAFSACGSSFRHQAPRSADSSRSGAGS